MGVPVMLTLRPTGLPGPPRLFRRGRGAAAGCFAVAGPVLSGGYRRPPEIYDSVPGERALFHCGELLRLLELPTGTRVVYTGLVANAPNDARTMQEQILAAIEHPVGCEPLSVQLAALAAKKPGAKVVFGFDDVSVPLPPMRAPDLRRLIMEICERKCVEAGITDITFVASIALHRFVRPDELREICGPTLFDKYYPHRMRNYNAVDEHESVSLGMTRHGEDVKICKSVAEADLMIYANLNYTPMDGGYKSYATGLVHYDSLRHNHDSATLAATRSLMDSGRSPMHKSFERMGRMIQKNTPVFHIETVVDEARFPWYMAWAQVLFRRMTWFQKIAAFLSCWAMRFLPLMLRKALFWGPLIRAPFGLVAAVAGETTVVHSKILEECFRGKVLEVDGQADILILAPSAIGPYTKDHFLNPLLVSTYSLGYYYNMYVGGVPLLRKGGAMIVISEMHYNWSSPAHDGYRELFEEVIAPSHGIGVEAHQARFAGNDRLNQIYRDGLGPAGVHGFYMWTWAAHALREVSKVFVVGAVDARGPAGLGWTCAGTIIEAVAMARAHLGDPKAKVTCFACPPPGYVRVTPVAGAEADLARAASAEAAAASKQAAFASADNVAS